MRFDLKTLFILLSFSYSLVAAQEFTQPEISEGISDSSSLSEFAPPETPSEISTTSVQDADSVSAEEMPTAYARDTSSLRAVVNEIPSQPVTPSSEKSAPLDEDNDEDGEEVDSLTAQIRSNINYAPADEAEETPADDTPYSPDQFVTRSLGTAIHRYSIESGAQFGMYNHIFNWFASFSVILWKGEAEINIPVTYYFSDLELEKGFTNPDHRLFTFALKYRKWHQNEDVGIFYGMGMRLAYWSLKYEKQVHNQITFVKEPSPFLVFIPQAEIGYQYSLNRDFSARGSLEMGYALSAYNNFEQADDVTHIKYQDNSFYWNLMVGLVYGF